MKRVLHVFVLLLFFKLEAQVIYRVAGTGTMSFSGNGGPAYLAGVGNVGGITIDKYNNLYFVDGNMIRKVDSVGIINTYAGSGVWGFSGDGGPAKLATFDHPGDLAIDTLGNLYVSDSGNSRIRKISANGIITTIAGNGLMGWSGDGGLAINAEIGYPDGMALDKQGSLWFCDLSTNNRIRKIDNTGIITTKAGNGVQGFSGDGGNSQLAQIFLPMGIDCDTSGNVYFVDYGNRRIRKINTSGIISTVGGTGVHGYSGDGGLAINAQISARNVVCDKKGNLFFTEDYCFIRKVDSVGIIKRIAGNGTAGFAGDGGNPLMASIGGLTGLTMDGNGNMYFGQASTGPTGQCVRAICQSSCFSTVNNNNSNNESIVISPNPNNGNFNLIVPFEMEYGTLVLFNNLGQKIHEQVIEKGNNYFSDKNFSTGIYTYIIEQNSNRITQGKLIIH